MVKTLLFRDIDVPVPGFGAMGIYLLRPGYNLSLEKAEPVLLKAIELGCTFWDTAVVYQAGVNEKLLGGFIRRHNVRDKVFIASKCGFNCFGDGRARRRLCAYSPLGHGWLVDDFPFKSPDDFAPDDFRRTVPKFQGENFYKNKAIVDEIKKIAAAKGCTLIQVALAWVAAQGMIPIPGTTKPHRLEEDFASRSVELTEEEKKEMRRILENAKPVGNRYSEKAQAMFGH
ncbi:Aldo-keto reductase yakc [NADP(+)] [Fulvia fulva]|nr:Aldo-keto reductase yakc [NADP(+)] [Fulvia fulva]